MRATLTSKSQLTLPAAIRRELALGPGDQLDFTLHPEGWLEVRPVRRPKRVASVRDLAGIAGPPPNGRVMTQEQLDEELGDAVAKHVLGAEEAPEPPDAPEAAA